MSDSEDIQPSVEYSRPVERATPWFADSVYEDRIDRVQEKMETLEIDVLVVRDPTNIHYLTGYRGWSFYLHQAAVVFSDHDEPRWLGWEINQRSAAKTTWMNDTNLRGYGSEFVEGKNPMVLVAEIIQNAGSTNDTIGVPIDGFFYSHRSHDVLQTALPDATFHDIGNLVNRVRMVKRDPEIEYVRQAAELTRKGHEAVRRVMGEGVRESEVVAEAYRAILRGTDEFGGTYPSIPPLLGSRHLTWAEDSVYGDGDIVSVELSGCRRRYHGPMARTYYLGDPPERVRRKHEKLEKGLDLMVELIEPGKTCSEVAVEYRDRAPHSPKATRHGYSIGMSYPPAWQEMSASLRPGDDTLLRPNMVFHLLLGAEQGQYQCTTPVLVTGNGCEALDDYPRELIVV